MKTRSLSLLIAGLAMLAQAHAGLVSYTSEATFDGQGTLAFDSTFDDFGAGFGSPGNPFTRGDVTFHSTDNLTWGNATSYSTLGATLIGNNYWSPVLGDVNSAPQYNMFGFEIAESGGSPVTFVLHTNLGDYTFSSETVADSNSGEIGFRGWVAGAGEYFTGFQYSTDNGNNGYLAGVTHVKVGNLGESVPDGTATLGLLGLGLSAIALVRRSRRV